MDKPHTNWTFAFETLGRIETKSIRDFVEETDRHFRIALHQIAAAAGIRTRIVAHQFRHYAASRTMPRIDARTAIHRHLNGGDAA